MSNINQNNASSAVKTDDKKEAMVPLSMLQDMRNEINELKVKQKALGGQTNEVKKEDDIPDNIVRLLEYEDKLIVSFNEKRGTWKKYNKERREDEIFMEIELEDKDGKRETREVEYMSIMQDGKPIKCDVLDTKVNKIEDKGKMVRVREVVDYKTVNSSNKVQQVVKKQEVIFAIKVPAPYNKKLAINAKYVNIM